nr:MAG TPA: hypothetical protein [Caudoviricetes sp.]
MPLLNLLFYANIVEYLLFKVASGSYALVSCPGAFLSYVSIIAYSREYVNTFYKNI